MAEWWKRNLLFTHCYLIKEKVDTANGPMSQYKLGEMPLNKN